MRELRTKSHELTAKHGKNAFPKLLLLIVGVWGNLAQQSKNEKEKLYMELCRY